MDVASLVSIATQQSRLRRQAARLTPGTHSCTPVVALAARRLIEGRRSRQESNSSCPQGLFRVSVSQQCLNTLRLPRRHFCIFNAAGHRIWLLTFTSTSGRNPASWCSTPPIRQLRASIPPSSGIPPPSPVVWVLPGLPVLVLVGVPDPRSCGSISQPDYRRLVLR